MVCATRLVANLLSVFLDEKWRHLFYGLALQRGSVPRKQCMTCEFLSFGQGDVFLCPSLLLRPDLNMGSKRWKTRYLWNFSALLGGGGKKLFKFSEMIEVHKNLRIR
uniref:Uncharacterized protein n=1 Tax=Gossypium raimondii TaxID=29730 RepID=A0A0D2QIJ8_GOSRA|nr:hypothetical protein B456_007G139700 [Gossypium raimondii]